jgi:hypothetical protein
MNNTANNTATLSNETIKRIGRLLEVRMKNSCSLQWKLGSEITHLEAKKTTALRTEKLAKLKAQYTRECDSFNQIRDDRMELMALLKA